MEKIVGIKFKNSAKVYYFAPGNGEYEKDTDVIVETSRGIEYATVAVPVCEVEDDKIVSPLKPVIRKATDKDRETVARNEARKDGAIKLAREKAEKCGLEMKIIDCEFTFDGSKVIFYFTAEGRVDFRELVKELSAAFRLRIELRQIGIRDEIKMIGGLAPCGRECCCSSCMPDFRKVSIKMAKNQGLSLNPGKISGLCGRLMCCLSYENEYYAEACKKVPKVGGEVITPDGKGQVVNVNMLKMEAKVKIEQKDAVSYRDYKVDELKFRRGGAPDREELTEEEKNNPELKNLTD